MGNWFSRVTPGERSGRDTTPEEVRLKCRCGATVVGLRTYKVQAISCRDCSESLVLMPQSVYPIPKSRKHKPKPPPAPAKKPLSKPSVGKDDPEEQAEVVISKHRTPPPLPITKPKKRRTDKAEDRPAPPPRPTPEELAAQREAWRKYWAQLFSPLRLAVLGIVVLLASTGMFLWRQQQISQAAQEYGELVRLGREALARKDYPTAADHLKKAVQALDLLKRSDPDSQQVRQEAREATAMDGLALIGLFDLIHEAQQLRQVSGGDWAAVVRQSYQGTWWVFDTHEATLQLDANQMLRLRMDLQGGTEPVRIVTASPKLTDWFSGQPPKHLIFAGQFEELRPIADQPGWELVLSGDSITLWGNDDRLSELGLEINEETRQVLALQRQRLGVK